FGSYFWYTSALSYFRYIPRRSLPRHCAGAGAGTPTAQHTASTVSTRTTARPFALLIAAFSRTASECFPLATRPRRQPGRRSFLPLAEHHLEGDGLLAPQNLDLHPLPRLVPAQPVHQVLGVGDLPARELRQQVIFPEPRPVRGRARDDLDDPAAFVRRV